MPREFESRGQASARALDVPRIDADLVLLHAPAYLDFRACREIYFPYLSTSGDVPITPAYEYFPVGFKSLQGVLGAHGYRVQLLNVASLLLRYPGIDLDRMLGALDARLLGIDLHWMVHVQGSLELARRLKRLHVDVPVVFGGISSTYYADELIRRPEVDLVMRGYDTHAPMVRLMAALRDRQPLTSVPNLLWKDHAGAIVDNGFSHAPDAFGCGVDWSRQQCVTSKDAVPIREVVSVYNTGCAFNCHWCGGSRDAFRRINGRRRSVARKPIEEVEVELDSMAAMAEPERFLSYFVGVYNEPRSRLKRILERVGAAGLRSVTYEQFHLPPDDVLRWMAAANRRTAITLSPESHDMRVAKLAGRGVYTPEEMERWIERALELGIHEIHIWYFVGMPEQDADSVMATVEACHHLLRKFAGKRVVPFVCPMVPFLDPGSTFFEQPHAHGYRVFFRTVEEHRRGASRASLAFRTNYETRWLGRTELIEVGNRAVRRLTEYKVEAGLLPPSVGQEVCERLDDALEFGRVVQRVDSIANAGTRSRELDRLGDEIARRNERVYYSGVANQAMPIEREVGERWFDEMLWPRHTLAALSAGAQPRTTVRQGSPA